MVTAGSFTDMADVSSREGAGSQAPGSQHDPEPRFRPRDQFWPYADLEEEPSDAELARLDPDLQAALLENPPARPFSCTLVFSPFDGPDYAAAVALAKAASDYLETGTWRRVSNSIQAVIHQLNAMFMDRFESDS